MKNVFFFTLNKTHNCQLYIKRGARTKARLPSFSKEKKTSTPEPEPLLVQQEIISNENSTVDISNSLKKFNQLTNEPRDSNNAATPYSVHPDDSLSYTKYKV
jgi:hypothetical protein